MRRVSHTVLIFGLALAGLMLGSSQTRAGLLPVLVTPTPESGNYRWTYAVVLTSDSTLKTGDFFTIYDFDGLVSGSDMTDATPGPFTFTTTPVGNTPSGTTPNDDPSKDNLTWTYNGPTTVVGQIGLGNFSVVSMYGDSANSEFTGRSHRQIDGKIDSNITDVDVASASPSVPEPATIALVAMGLPLLGARRLVRRKNAA